MDRRLERERGKFRLERKRGNRQQRPSLCPRGLRRSEAREVVAQHRHQVLENERHRVDVTASHGKGRRHAPPAQRCPCRKELTTELQGRGGLRALPMPYTVAVGAPVSGVHANGWAAVGPRRQGAWGICAGTNRIASVPCTKSSFGEMIHVYLSRLTGCEQVHAPRRSSGGSAPGRR